MAGDDIAFLSAAELTGARELNFTRRYGERWEGLDHRILLGTADPQRALGRHG